MKISAQSTQSSMKPSRWLMRQAKLARGWISITVTISLLNGLLLILQAGLMARIVNNAFILKQPRSVLLPLFILFLVALGVRAVLAWAREVVSFRAATKIRAKLRKTVIEHIMQLGPLRSHKKRTGGLTTTAIEQIEALQGFYAEYLPQITIAVILPLIILAFVFPFSWVAGLLLLLTAPLLPLFMAFAGMEAAQVNQRHFQTLARMSGHFLDLLQGLTTLKLFAQTKAQLKSIAQISDNFRNRTMSVLRLAFLSSGILEFFSALSIALLATYLGLSFLNYIHFGFYGSKLTLEHGLFILLLAPEFYFPLRQLGIHYHTRAEAVGAAEEILKLLKQPLSKRDRNFTAIVKPEHIAIQFADVYYRYGKEQPYALQGCGFKIAAGEHVAVIGPSGAGKSTIINMLLGFLLPEQGKVWINGIDLASLDLEDWRCYIAWVGQSPYLFYGTVEENLRLAKADATEAEIHDALRQANALEFVRELPDGIHTYLGERGIGLSGGQAQRIGLARAYLKAAPLLLLDEPTTGLDSVNRCHVLQGLMQLAKGRTTLTITHDLSIVQHFDRILQLEKGRIITISSPHDFIPAEVEKVVL